MDIYDPIAEALGVSPLSIIYDYSEYGVGYIGVGPNGTNAFAGKRHTEESKAKMSARRKGRIVSEETRAKISAAKKAKNLQRMAITATFTQPQASC
jgi:hypothetical protein